MRSLVSIVTCLSLLLSLRDPATTSHNRLNQLDFRDILKNFRHWFSFCPPRIRIHLIDFCSLEDRLHPAKHLYHGPLVQLRIARRWVWHLLDKFASVPVVDGGAAEVEYVMILVG
jgi:hypothetical protein